MYLFTHAQPLLGFSRWSNPGRPEYMARNGHQKAVERERALLVVPGDKRLSLQRSRPGE